MRRLLPIALAAVLPAALEAQNFTGTWTLPTGNGGQLVLTLSQQGRGSVSGSLSGNGTQGTQGANVAPAGPIATTPQDQQIAQLLTSSRWCSFRYSQISGATSTERVQFTPDGRFVMGSNRETSSSNQYGSYYGNSSGGDRGMWRVQNGVLMMSSNGVQWEQYPLRITQNSNGYPIVHANNKEYSQCN